MQGKLSSNTLHFDDALLEALVTLAIHNCNTEKVKLYILFQNRVQIRQQLTQIHFESHQWTHFPSVSVKADVRRPYIDCFDSLSSGFQSVLIALNTKYRDM